MPEQTIHIVWNDLPAGVSFPDGRVAVDTETNGLDVNLSKLLMCQVGDGRGNVWLVRFDGSDYSAPNLKAVLTDPALTKIFHYARFDLAMLQGKLGITIPRFFCTKIASKLCRPKAAKHNLWTLVKDYCGTILDKGAQMSDWAAPELSEVQVAYAASDVLYLHRIHDALAKELADLGLTGTMDGALAWLPHRVNMDIRGLLAEDDLFAHH
jgi:ribonuclease D